MRLLLFLLVAIVLAGCISESDSTSSRTAVEACLTDCTPRTGIVSAFGKEADLLLERLEEPREHAIAGRRFVTGALDGVPVVIVLSGIGSTNAVMTAQILVDHFRPRALVFSGIAGGVDPSLEVGDVAVPAAWTNYLAGYFAPDTAMPAPCGEPGELGCLGLAMAGGVAPSADGLFLRRSLTPRAGTDADEPRLRYPADPAMLETVEALAEGIEAELEPICRHGEGCRQPSIHLGATGLTGDAFMADPDYRRYLYRELDGRVVDMETAAVARVAFAHRLPFIAFRSVSDLAGADPDPDVSTFFASGIAEHNAATVTAAFVTAWDARTGRP